MLKNVLVFKTVWIIVPQVGLKFVEKGLDQLHHAMHLFKRKVTELEEFSLHGLVVDFYRMIILSNFSVMSKEKLKCKTYQRYRETRPMQGKRSNLEASSRTFIKRITKSQTIKVLNWVNIKRKPLLIRQTNEQATFLFNFEFAQFSK